MELNYEQMVLVFSQLEKIDKTLWSQSSIDMMTALQLLTLAGISASQQDMSAYVAQVIEEYAWYKEDITRDFLEADIKVAVKRWEKICSQNKEQDDLEQDCFGNYMSRGEYIQIDYGRLSLATTRGFTLQRSWEACEHSGTDGTVDCPDCGKTSTEFICECTEFLDALTGYSRIWVMSRVVW